MSGGLAMGALGLMILLTGATASAEAPELAPPGECAAPRRDPASANPRIAPIHHLAPLPPVAAEPVGPPPPPLPTGPDRDPCSDPGSGCGRSVDPAVVEPPPVGDTQIP
jgi:hypothetical protein